MKMRDDLRSIVAAALIAYSAFTALSAQARVRRAAALEAELSERHSALCAEVEALRRLPPASDELMERLARERLGLVLPGEIIFYFADTH